MNLNQLLTTIHMPKEVTEMLLAYDRKTMKEVSPKELEEMFQENLSLYPDASTDSFCQMKEKLKDPENFGTLWFQLKLAVFAEEEYKKRGISEKIYVDTMKFFSRTIKEGHDIYGKWMHFSFEWGYRQVFLRLFRLGDLEFEFIQKETAEIFIHIPNDARLQDENRNQSYEELKDFTKEHFQEFKEASVFCDSWLLSPTLRQFLSTSSKIRHFQDDFLLLEANSSNESFWNWLFKTDDKTIKNLPENTSLQRKVKKFLQENGKIGDGLGKLIR